ncbi:hypothetical protein EYF80_056234 [Liparis tanakae]|uniref:Uncharacterized protein n=1 Tax=Liparis tanakae TaxID=230148 RepID=A0A4Z2EZ05_9TELE|nr:hypothetical protein EYF80_056234 [Liparis tanakae]
MQPLPPGPRAATLCLGASFSSSPASIGALTHFLKHRGGGAEDGAPWAAADPDAASGTDGQTDRLPVGLEDGMPAEHKTHESEGDGLG